jgi:hypothetical protein
MSDWKSTKQIAKEYGLTAGWLTYLTRRYKKAVKTRRIYPDILEVYVPDLLRIKRTEEEGRPDDLVPVASNAKALVATRKGAKIWYKFGQAFVSARDLADVNHTPRTQRSAAKSRSDTVKGALFASVQLDRDAAVEYLKSLAKGADLEIQVGVMLRALRYVRESGAEIIRFRNGKVFSVSEKSEDVTV